MFEALADLRRQDAGGGAAGHERMVSVPMSRRNRTAISRTVYAKRSLGQSDGKEGFAGEQRVSTYPQLARREIKPPVPYAASNHWPVAMNSCKLGQSGLNINRIGALGRPAPQGKSRRGSDRLDVEEPCRHGAIVGVRNAQQARVNVGAARFELTSDEVAEIEDRVAREAA